MTEYPYSAIVTVMIDLSSIPYSTKPVTAPAEVLQRCKVEPSDGTPEKIRYECPRCGSKDLLRPLNGVVVASATFDRTTEMDADNQLTVELKCICTDHKHPSTPKGDSGCGASWSVTLRKTGDLWVVGAPDPQFVHDAARVVQIIEKTALSLTDVRTIAEKWLGAITTLLGLFSIAAAVIGRDAFDDLDSVARLAAMGLAVAGVLLAVTATLSGYTAAFGWARLDQLPKTDAEQPAWIEKAERQFREGPVKAATALHRAVTTGAAATCAFLVALGVILFGGRPPSNAGAVRVTYSDTTGKHTRCGDLVELDKTTIKLLVSFGGRGDPQTIPLASTQQIEVLESCK